MGALNNPKVIIGIFVLLAVIAVAIMIPLLLSSSSGSKPTGSADRRLQVSQYSRGE